MTLDYFYKGVYLSEIFCGREYNNLYKHIIATPSEVF